MERAPLRHRSTERCSSLLVDRQPPGQRSRAAGAPHRLRLSFGCFAAVGQQLL